MEKRGDSFCEEKGEKITKRLGPELTSENNISTFYRYCRAKMEH
jgi:hypothetical protein